MGISLNRTTIIGNVGSDIEMRFNPSGKPVSSFRVATNSQYTDKDGQKREEVEWFSVTCWNKLAEICNQYLHKGSLVYVEGRMKTRSWEGQDGVKHYKTDLIANTVKFLDKINQTAKTETAEESADDVDIQDVPF